MVIRAHDQITTLHLGDHKMYNWLIERCWWYGMRSDVQKHAKSCLTCHRMKFSASPGYGYQQMKWWNGPGKMICIDLVALTQPHTSSQGTRYLFTILDCFSHYPDAYPLQTATAKDCAECIFKWCSSNGVPQEIRSDGGSNLNISDIFKELYTLLWIKSIVGNAYAPKPTPWNVFTDGLELYCASSCSILTWTSTHPPLIAYGSGEPLFAGSQALRPFSCTVDA